MSKLTEAMDQFYQYAKDDDVINNELSNILVSNDIRVEFFNLCKRFADISLNAPKYTDKESGDVVGCFQFSDIEKAKNAARVFYFKYQLNDLESFMETIHKIYHFAVEWEDRRAKGGLIQSPSYNYGSGFMGTYYNFQKLPEDIWNRICEETKAFIKKER